MSREAQWTTTSVDFDKLRTQAQNRQLTNTDQFLASEMYVTEQGQHTELKSFYDRITGGVELSEEERLIEFKKLLKPLVIIDPSLDQEITSFPIPEELQKKLQTIASKERNDEILPEVRFDERYQQIGALSATAALGLSSGKSKEDIKISVDESIRNFQEENSNPQIVLDVPRTPISFHKDGETYKFPSIPRATTEVIRTDLSAFSRTNNLNLTGEQIDYIMSSTDQKGSVGAAFMWAQMRNPGSPLDDIKYRESIIDPTAGESRCHIDIEGSQVKLTVLRGHRGHAMGEDFHVIEGEPGPVTFKTIQADITELKEDRLLPGLASSHVTPILLHTSNHTETPYKVVSSIADEASAATYGIKEICEIKIKSELTETPEQRIDLIARRSPNEFTAQMISSMADIKGYSPEEMAMLTAYVALAKDMSSDESQKLASQVSQIHGLEQPLKLPDLYSLQEQRINQAPDRTKHFGLINEFVENANFSIQRTGEYLARYTTQIGYNDKDQTTILEEFARQKRYKAKQTGELVSGFFSKKDINKEVVSSLVKEMQFSPENYLEFLPQLASNIKSAKEASDLINEVGNNNPRLNSPAKQFDQLCALTSASPLLQENAGTLLGEFAKTKNFNQKNSLELLTSFSKTQKLTLNENANLIKQYSEFRGLSKEDKYQLLTNFVANSEYSPSQAGELICKSLNNEDIDINLVPAIFAKLEYNNTQKAEFFGSLTKSQNLSHEESGKLILSYTKASKMKQEEQREFLGLFSETNLLSLEEQGTLLRGYQQAQTDLSPIVCANFLSSYCIKEELSIKQAASIMASYLSDPTPHKQVEYLAPFMSEMQKPEKIEFLAEYTKANSMSYKESAELILAYTKSSDTELSKEQTATLKKMAEKREFTHSQCAELCSASILLRSDKSNKLNLRAASSELSEFVGDLDPQRARRYIIKMAEKEGVKTDVGIMERAGNWFRDIGDRFQGRKTPEEMLFKGDRDKMKASYTSPHAASDSTRSAASGLVGQEPPSLTRAISGQSVSSESTGLDSPSPRSPSSPAPIAGSKDDSELRASKDRLHPADKKKAVLATGRPTPLFPPRPKEEPTGRGRSGSMG